MASVSTHASPSAVAEVHQLLESGKIQEAAQRIQSHLKQNSGDVQMRFLQGVVAAEQKKYDQAIKVFTALTEDYPTLPEPYNNLAVLYAAKGDERKAAQVLEQAIRTNPSYATAHENLGDLYARMASDAYAKALQLDSNRQTAQPKLALIKQIFPAPTVQAAVDAPVVSAVAAPAEPSQTAEVVKAAAPSTAPVPVQPAVETQEVAKIEPAKAEVKKPEQHKADKHPQTKAVEAAVMAWAKAWSQQNMNGYYAAYSDKFEPQGSSLAAWKAERRDRIIGKPEITVEVQDLKVSFQGDQRAVASFRQYYAAGGYKATTRKVLRLQHEGGKWRITREETGR